MIKRVYRRFEENLKKREILLNERENGPPCDPSRDPLYSVQYAVMDKYIYIYYIGSIVKKGGRINEDLAITW